MIDLNKKYSQVRENDPPALGNLIHWHIRQRNVKKKSVSEYLGIASTTLNQYFKQNSFQVTILWRVSQVVNYNFFMDLGERLGIAYETKLEKQLKAELLEKEAELKKLQFQISVMEQLYKKG